MDGLLANSTPRLSFTPDEEELGQKNLQEIGLPPHTDFICFIARDSAYLEEVFPHIEWNYQGFRDASIQNYVHDK